MTGLYCIKDVVAQQFGPPMVARTEMAASRSYLAMCSQGKLSPEDFEIYQIGTYDEDTGIAKTHEPVKIVPVYKRSAGLEEVMA